MKTGEIRFVVKDEDKSNLVLVDQINAVDAERTGSHGIDEM